MGENVSVDRLMELLQVYRGDGVFNQYLDLDPASSARLALERPDGAAIRRRNLYRYLDAFASASYVLSLFRTAVHRRGAGRGTGWLALGARPGL